MHKLHVMIIAVCYFMTLDKYHNVVKRSLAIFSVAIAALLKLFLDADINYCTCHHTRMHYNYYYVYVILLLSHAVSHPIAHSLPHEFMVSVYGSQINGRCTSMTEGIPGDSISICDGTSVLNDGIVKTLGQISNDPQSQWAGQLFTMNRTLTPTGVANNITLSFKVGEQRIDHDRIEIVVFNCPQKGIYAPTVTVVIDTSFRPRAGTFGFFLTSASLQATSCNHLLKFCVKFNTLSSQFYSIQFPYQEGSDLVFVSEVTFLNAAGEPCDPRMPEAIAAPTSTLPITGIYNTDLRLIVMMHVS